MTVPPQHHRPILDMHQEPAAPIVSPPCSDQKIIVSCIIGNALQWYDFVIYAYFVTVLGALFFPGANNVVQIIASWGIFWCGFLARPLGSLFFGYIGDKQGRKKALSLSMLMVAIPTTLMGMLPTYEQAGMLAPLLLVLLRAIQGFAIGGEFTGSIVFLIEHAPTHRKGLWGSWTACGSIIGIILGSTVAAVLHYGLSETQIQTWGWRLPFLIGMTGSIIGAYIRRSLPDSRDYLQYKAGQKDTASPLKMLFSSYKLKTLLLFLLQIFEGTCFYLFAVFLPLYITKYLNYPEYIVLFVHTLNMVFLALFTLLGGFLSDLFGGRSILRGAGIGLLLGSYPVFMLLGTHSIENVFYAEWILAFLIGLIEGSLAVTMAKIMPITIRCSGMSLANNLSIATVGGGIPLIATRLIESTHDLLSPAYILMLASLVGLITLCFFKKNHETM